MLYGTFCERIYKIIDQHDLRDDGGQPFSLKTHHVQHSYGRRLVELGLDDFTISRLLGHKTLGSVQHYRKMSDDNIAKETEGYRIIREAFLEKYLKGW